MRDKKHHSDYNKQWRIDRKEHIEQYNLLNKERKKKYNLNYILKKNYGINFEEYKKMFDEQNGCCAICGQHQSKLKFALAVDHNHQTKKIRGLLCGKCNTGIGNLDDDIAILQSAIIYLNK